MSDRSGYRYNPIDPESGTLAGDAGGVCLLRAFTAEATGFPEFAPDEHTVMAVPPIIIEARFCAV